MKRSKILIAVFLVLSVLITIFGIRFFWLNNQKQESVKETKKIEIKWTPYVKFEDVNEINQYLNKEITDFYNNLYCENIALDRHKEDEVNHTINSCNDYFFAIREGFSVYTAMASETIKSCILYPCGYLHLFEGAESSEKSYFKNFRLKENWRELPLYQIFSAGEMGMVRKELVDASVIEDYGDYYIKGSAEAEIESLHGDTYQEGWSFELQLMGWADFNGDGIEDLLIWHSYNRKGARYVVNGYSVVSRAYEDEEIFLSNNFSLLDIESIAINKIESQESDLKNDIKKNVNEGYETISLSQRIKQNVKKYCSTDGLLKRKHEGDYDGFPWISSKEEISLIKGFNFSGFLSDVKDSCVDNINDYLVNVFDINSKNSDDNILGLEKDGLNCLFLKNGRYGIYDFYLSCGDDLRNPREYSNLYKALNPDFIPSIFVGIKNIIDNGAYVSGGNVVLIYKKEAEEDWIFVEGFQDRISCSFFKKHNLSPDIVPGGCFFNDNQEVDWHEEKIESGVDSKEKERTDEFTEFIDLQTYRNDYYGFQFNYPKSWGEILTDRVWQRDRGMDSKRITFSENVIFEEEYDFWSSNPIFIELIYVSELDESENNSIIDVFKLFGEEGRMISSCFSPLRFLSADSDEMKLVSDYLCPNFEEGLDSCNTVSYEIITVDGKKAVRHPYSGCPPAGVHIEEIHFVHNSYLFTIKVGSEYLYSEPQKDDWLDVFYQLVDSFELI